MSNHEVAAIFERNLVNAFAQYHKKMRAVVVRALLRFARESGCIEFDVKLSLYNRVFEHFGGSRKLCVDDLLQHLVYKQFNRDKCWKVFKQEFVNILYYGSQETYESAGVALLILAADLGLLKRPGKLFRELSYLLHDYYYHVTREEIEERIMDIEERCCKSDL